MKERKKGEYFREEAKKWLLNLLSSLKMLPKRSDAPPSPRHPEESVES